MKTHKLVKRWLRLSGQSRTREQFRDMVKKVDDCDQSERGRRRSNLKALVGR